MAKKRTVNQILNEMLPGRQKIFIRRSQQDGERVTKIYNIHGSGENCNLNFY